MTPPVAGDGYPVTCVKCGNDAFVDARKMEAFPKQSMVQEGETVWVCVMCGAQVDIAAWTAGRLP